MDTTFRVPDMTCGHCAGTITAAVRAKDPAARLEFDIDEHLVRINSASVNESELQSVISAAGYTPTQQTQKTAEPSRRAGCGCGCGTKTAQRLDIPQAGTAAKEGCCS